MSTCNTGPPFVLPLTDPRATDISLVGGKGANLARLVRAEFPVPKGFVVTTAAYNVLLAESDIPDRIRALESLGPQDTEAVAAVGGELRGAIQSLSVPSEVRTAIEDAVADIGVNEAYAARSSATAEDLPSASFAGQHETLLNVQGEAEVVEAVISGTVADDPVVERAPTDRPCPFCSAQVEVSYEQERVEMYCTECPGVVSQEDSGEHYANEFGTLGAISLPPAGVEGRTPAAMFRAARAWSHLDLLAASAGICSRCSGVVEHSVSVCRNHDASEGTCDHFNRRYAVLFEVECSHCNFDRQGIAIVCLLGTTELLSFVTDHGANPLLPETHDVAPGALANYKEEILSHDPFEVALSFTIRDETLTLTIDEDASVVNATRDRASESV